MNLNELDVIFISYDEPNAEYNWAHLLKICPWAKRVDGVYGSDAAHKAAANLSETQHFFSIDGDNEVMKHFLNFHLPEGPDWAPQRNHSYSFNAINSVNGLTYGNGGPKIWDKDMVLNMRTHENSNDPRTEIEFCWLKNYRHRDFLMSTTVINSTPYQAFRAGFREGVKMSMDFEGKRLNPLSFSRDIMYPNFERLIVWCNVGSEIENGKWAIYGARLGVHKTCLTNWDYREVRDFKKLWEIWEGACPAIRMTEEIGDELNQQLGIPMGEFTPRAAEVMRCLMKK